MSVKEIEKEVNDVVHYYIAPVKAYQYMKSLIFEIHTLEGRVKELEEGFEMMKFGWSEETRKFEQAEARIKELEQVISSDVLKDHNGCQIYHDEEYTKLESKFYQAESRIKVLMEAIEAGYYLSTWAATIKWSHKANNTQEWLDGLKERIEKVQELYKALEGKS